MKKIIAIIAALTFSVGDVFAQDDIIMRAMKDEMARSMNELQIDGKEKPFFIAYGVQDFRIFSTFASLGALLRSGEDPTRGKTIRVLAGDYNFNDESMDNDLFSDPGAIDIQMPINDDYYGTRRALWASTDAVYKGAARKFQRHQQTLKEKNQTLESIPHRTFAKTEPVTHIKTITIPAINPAKYDEYVKALSAVFRSYPEIDNSTASINYIYGHQYFANSEGTTIKAPYQLTILQVSAHLKNKNGETAFDQIVHYALTPEDLPPLNRMREQVELFAQQLIANMKLPVLDEAYTGPVLFSGRGAARILQALLFNSTEGLIASNVIQTPNEYRAELSAALDNKIGKQIIDPSLTVMATPHLAEFQGQRLLGSFEVDGEGVRPPDEIVLVEKGILRELLNDRTLTSETQKANGHADGPGVISITSENTIPKNAMKQRLIELIREESLEYGLMVEGDLDSPMGVVNVVKVFPDGKEERYRYARLSRLSLRSLRKVDAASTERGGYNLQSGATQLATFITPQAILISDIDIEPLQMPFFKEELYVPSPLQQKSLSNTEH